MRRLFGGPVENSNQNTGLTPSESTRETYPDHPKERDVNLPSAPRHNAATRALHIWEGWKARCLRRSHLKELSITVSAYWAAYLVYLFAGQVVYSDFEGTAMANARRIIEFERSIGIFWEPSWQEWAVSFPIDFAGPGGLAVLLNWTYILTFAPLMGAISATIYIMNRPAYRHYRKIFLLSYGLAIVVFIVFPLAPPRMVPDHFLDTIAAFGPSGYGTREMGRFYNAYAAMPSLHFGWTVVFAILFLRTRNGLAKIFGVFYPGLMLLAIVITANHYIIDAIAGGLLVIVSLIFVEFHWWRLLHLTKLRTGFGEP